MPTSAPVGERDVRRDGRPVEEGRLPKRDAGLLAQLAHARDDAPSGVVRGGGDLVDRDFSRLLVDEDQVREGAADVDADTLHLLLPRSAGTISSPTRSICSRRPFR
jgi:hypothetical protein